ncbi:MAG: glycosyl hydrolase family 18 protein [Fimbriimonas sp.]|nr:glycosyl hydrolase family 18 protein [Fimbriimonas sp.]
MVPLFPLVVAALIGSYHGSSPIKMNGWLVFDEEGTSLQSFRDHAGMLESVSVDWIKCNPQGMVLRQSHPTSGERTEILQIAKKNGVKVYALVANEGFQPKNVEAAMISADTMKAHAEALVKIATEDGIDGIDLDYESLLAKDRDSFTKLVQIIAEACHAKHLQFVMAVHAKESEPGTWDGAQAQDFAALGKVADRIRVMTYDNHWESSDAGPIAPPDWVNRVMTFAASVVPPAKLDLGIPAYGYDWLGKKADSFGWDGWTERVKNHGPGKRDSLSHELTLTYDGRTAFFADGEASRPKFEIARRLGLNGLAMWRLGSEDPRFWKLYEQLSK